MRPNVARGELNSRPQAWILVRPEVRAMEIRLIREHCTNDPAIGYNLTPRFQAPAEDTVVPRCAGTPARKVKPILGDGEHQHLRWHVEEYSSSLSSMVRGQR